MCIFSRAVAHVAATRIFVGEQPGGRQALIYAMEVEVAAPTAMILPLPTPVDAGEVAVHFVSLAAYRDLFDDLARAFPAVALGLAPQPASRHAPHRRPTTCPGARSTRCPRGGRSAAPSSSARGAPRSPARRRGSPSGS